jgi:hypothetical protein
VKRVAGDGDCFSPGLALLLETETCYFVFRYITANAETVLCLAEYNHEIR